MNRRGFLSSMLKAGVAAAFLPGAERVWKQVAGEVLYKPEPVAILNPEWVNAPFEVKFLWDHHYAIENPYPARYASAADYLRGRAIPPFILRPSIDKRQPLP